MSTNKKAKITAVREHPRRVPVSEKNPSGQTIVDRHLRHVDGQYLDLNLIEVTFKDYDRKNILYPAKGKLNLPNEDKYDDYISVSLALGARWLAYKKIYADRVLKRAATSDQVI